MSKEQTKGATPCPKCEQDRIEGEAVARVLANPPEPTAELVDAFRKAPSAPTRDESVPPPGYTVDLWTNYRTGEPGTPPNWNATRDGHFDADFDTREEAVAACWAHLREHAHAAPTAAPGVARACIFREIDEERARQDAKWGPVRRRPNVDPVLAARGADAQRIAEHHEIPTEARAKFICQTAESRGQCSFTDIVVEELCEAVATHHDETKLRYELVQLAACVVQWIEALALAGARGRGRWEVSMPTEPGWYWARARNGDHWEVLLLRHGKAYTSHGERWEAEDTHEWGPRILPPGEPAPTEAPPACAATYAECVEAAAKARTEIDEWPEWKRNLSRAQAAPSPAPSLDRLRALADRWDAREARGIGSGEWSWAARELREALASIPEAAAPKGGEL